MRPGGLRVVLQVVVVAVIVVLFDEVAANDWQDDCVLRPTADHATRAECEFKSIVTYIRLSTKSSIESLQITAGRNVVVDREALAKFTKLRNVYITGVGTVTFRFNSLRSIKTQNAISLTVDLQHSGIMVLDPGALSDWQNSGSKILLENIMQVTVSEQALAPNSTFEFLTIRNVPALLMETGSVQANISNLRLQNVTMVCQPNTFTGIIRRMSLTSLSSSSMERGCIKADKPGWKSLSLSSSHVKHVETSAIQGTIEEVEIEDCALGNVKPGGLDLDVSRFSLTSCEIGELRENALQVRANLSISLHSLQVAALYSSALVGLKITRSDGYRSPGGQQPQVCVSSLTVNDFADDALRLDPASPVSLFGRVCPPGVGSPQGSARCIGADSRALVSRKVFRSRCCFDGIGGRSPVCPTYGWIPYVAVAAGVVLIAAVALFCYRRKLREKRWQVARRPARPRVSIVPSVEGLESDASGHASPDCDFPVREHDKGGSRGTDDVFAEMEQRGAAVDTGPLANWLQTLREAVPQQPERASTETIEMAESGASDKPGMPGETVLLGEACANYETEPANAEAGSDTESVLHEDAELVKSKKAEEGRQKASCELLEDYEGIEVNVPNTSDAASRDWDEDQNVQDRSKKTKKKKKKSAPTRPSGASIAGSRQQPEPELPMPVYAQVTKRKKTLMVDQPVHLASSSVEVLMNSATSSHNLYDDDSNATSTRNAVTFNGKASTIGRRPPDLVYADVFNSLPRVPNVDPAARHRGRRAVDSSFYADVYHTLDTTRSRGPSSDVAPQCSAESDETYDDVLGAAKNTHLGSRRRPEASANEGIPLIGCTLYRQEYDGPHTSRRDRVAGHVRRQTRRSEEFSLYAEVKDEEAVAGNFRTVPRGRYVYVEKSERDHSGGESGVTTSYIYAEISDFSPAAKRNKGLQKITTENKDREVPSYATVHKKTQDTRGRDDSKTGGWFSLKRFSGKGPRDKSRAGGRK